MRKVAALVALGAVAAGPTTRPSAHRTYDCVRVGSAITIDGKADEAWAAVAWSDDFVALRDDGKAPVRTRAKMAWDDQYLYVFAELQTPHVHAGETRRDSNLYATDGVFELFIDPDADSRDYCEIQVNAVGTVMDLLMDKPYIEHGHFDMAWDAGARVAVAVDGTVNDSSDVDRGWSLEMAIPWKSLATMAHRPCPPVPGDAWRMQLARCEHQSNVLAGGKYGPVKPDRPAYSAWSPQGENNLHAPDRWGTLRFTSPPTSPRP